MPTYEYICEACQHTFDEFQSITAEPLKKCPRCKKKKLRRAFGTGAAVIFKGSGFYQTDYRSESYKAGAKADQEAGKSTDKSATSDTNGAAEPAKGATAKKSAAKTSKSSTPATDD